MMGLSTDIREETNMPESSGTLHIVGHSPVANQCQKKLLLFHRASEELPFAIVSH